MPPLVDEEQTVVAAGLAARKIVDDLSWGVGSIRPQAGQGPVNNLIQVVLDNIVAVDDTQATYSACTDGRIPVRLLDGAAVPVREQMVGADTVSAFYAAEALGDRFYKDPAAPVADRVRAVVEFLQANGLQPSSHVGCGAAAGFAAITENAIKFSQDERFAARQRALLPEGVYSADLHAAMLQASQARLDSGVYDGLTADVFLQAVEAASGQQAIAELQDDGRGVHGHVEEAIVRVRVPGKAIDEASVAKRSGGREVFGVNDLRMERLARLFGRGADDDYRIAYMALEDFTDCGHGTLAHGLPTYIVTEAGR